MLWIFILLLALIIISGLMAAKYILIYLISRPQFTSPIRSSFSLTFGQMLDRIQCYFSRSKHPVIGLPFNLVHKVHVNREFNWKGEDPTLLFDILDRLGSGAFGTVFKARHKQSDQLIALKCIAFPTGSEKGLLAIKEEIEILRLCNFPNVVNYYGCYFRKNELLIMMDYCSVGSVRDGMLLLQCTLTEDEIGYICLHTLRALAYLHSRKPIIVHRDVKSANILIDDKGRVKIADFGVSDQIQNTVAPESHFGTIFWMAPEMLKKTFHNHTADIWSLGITAIEMAEGSPPLSDITTLMAMFQIPRLPPPKLKDPSKWSPEFNHFISRCLTKDYRHRPSASELLNDAFILKTGQLTGSDKCNSKADIAFGSFYKPSINSHSESVDQKFVDLDSPIKSFIENVIQVREHLKETNVSDCLEQTDTTFSKSYAINTAGKARAIDHHSQPQMVSSRNQTLKSEIAGSTFVCQQGQDCDTSATAMKPADDVSASSYCVFETNMSIKGDEDCKTSKPHPLDGVKIDVTTKPCSNLFLLSDHLMNQQKSPTNQGERIRQSLTSSTIMVETGTQTTRQFNMTRKHWFLVTIAFNIAFSLIFNYLYFLIMRKGSSPEDLLPKEE